MPSRRSCPVSAFRFNSSAAEAWVTHEWNHAKLEGQDIGSISVGVGLLLASTLVLLKGEALSKPVFFLTGAVGVLVPSFAIVNAILGNFHLSIGVDCTLLIVIPLICALLAGALSVWFVKLAFVMLGLVSGGAIGYYLYVLVLHTISSRELVDGYSVVFCVTVAVCALCGAALSYRLQRAVLMAATSALGAVGFVVALDLALLGRLERRFLWLLDARSASQHLSSTYVFGPIIGAVPLAVFGFWFQRRQKERKSKKTRAHTTPLIAEQSSQAASIFSRGAVQ